MINYPEKAVYTYDDLVDILRILRAPGGCPWDREQTHESNRRNFLEEAYEAAEAFDLDDRNGHESQSLERCCAAVAPCMARAL